MNLPKTDAATPRPVWARHLQRTLRNTEPMPPPTDEEKSDAIKVLADPNNAIVRGLWEEATAIFDEASIKSRREALTELTRLAEESPGGYR